MKSTALRDGVRAVHEEGGGVVEVVVVRPEDVGGLLLGALAGSEKDARILRLASATIERVKRAPRRKPALCSCCPRPIRNKPFVQGVAQPYRDSPDNALGFALCLRCAPTREAGMAKALEAVRKVWPKLRTITVHGEGGRA